VRKLCSIDGSTTASSDAARGKIESFGSAADVSLVKFCPFSGPAFSVLRVLKSPSSFGHIHSLTFQPKIRLSRTRPKIELRFCLIGQWHSQTVPRVARSGKFCRTHLNDLRCHLNEWTSYQVQSTIFNFKIIFGPSGSAKEIPVPRSTRYSIDIYRSSLECMISQGYSVDIYWTVLLPGVLPGKSPTYY